MSADRPTDLQDVLSSTLAELRRGVAAPSASEEDLVRILAAWDRELRLSLRALAAPPPPDRAALDEEETPAAAQRRADEYRGRCEGFVKAIALTLGYEAAARIEAEARRRAAAGEPGEEPGS